MGHFSGISFYAAPDESAVQVPPPEQLEYDTTELATSIHRDLLNRGKGFQGAVQLPHHQPLEFNWNPVTETSGFVLWRTANQVRAASCLLSGIETEADLTTFRITLARLGLQTPRPVFSTMLKEPKPLITTVHYDIRSVGDPVLATVAPVFAAAFFAMFR
jgi:hypothetical protein